jgi:hypothetical protein
VITGALILAAGILAGWLLRSLPARHREPEPVEAVCGCEHHHAMHDPETGHCHAQVDKPTKYDECGDPVAFTKVQCPCRQYSGPEPLPTVFAPGIAGGAGQ